MSAESAVMSRRTPWEVGIIADDLTGANDTAVQLARAGWPTLLALDPAAVSDAAGAGVQAPAVLATTTDCRDAGQAAADVTSGAVQALEAAGASHLYVKVDSTMRGSVDAQVRGALRAWRCTHPDAFAVVCPAYPAMGRTVVDGFVRVDGIPLEDGAPGLDPVTPVATSSLAELLPGSVHVPVPAAARGDAEELARTLQRAAAGGARVLTVDATDHADLDLVAAAVVRCAGRAVPCGSAGLADHLAGRWREELGLVAARPVDTVCDPDLSGRGAGAGPVLVLVTSLHRSAREQVARLADALGPAGLSLAPGERDLADDAALDRWCAANLPDGPDVPGVTVLVAPERTPRAGGAAAPGSGRPAAGSAAVQVAARLADVVARSHRRTPLRAAVITGGDGARALLDRWGCEGIAVLGAVSEGVPAGLLVGGEAGGLPVVTKAGGFGAPGVLVDAVRALGGLPRAAP